jgi:hypothetical protein
MKHADGYGNCYVSCGRHGEKTGVREKALTCSTVGTTDELVKEKNNYSVGLTLDETQQLPTSPTVQKIISST